MEHEKYLKWHHQRNKARANDWLPFYGALQQKACTRASEWAEAPIRDFFFEDLQLNKGESQRTRTRNGRFELGSSVGKSSSSKYPVLYSVMGRRLFLIPCSCCFGYRIYFYLLFGGQTDLYSTWNQWMYYIIMFRAFIWLFPCYLSPISEHHPLSMGWGDGTGVWSLVYYR